MKIPITKPYLGDLEKSSVLGPLESGWLVQGPCTAEFERAFAAFTGAAHAVAVSNCTTALHLSLMAAGVGPGDRVVVPSFTYVASANAVRQCGAEPVFCDIELPTFNLDPKQLARVLEADRDRRIKAVMVVHLFGLCASMDQILAMAQTHNVTVIEDAACAFDAWVGSRHAGTMGLAGCFSFHPRKAITCGEGGMILTADERLAGLCRSMRNHGAGTCDYERHVKHGGSLLPEFNVPGFNYRMTDLQGALGLAQLRRAEEIMEKRRYWAQRYREALRSLDSICLPMELPGYRHGYQSFVCLFCAPDERAGLSLDAILARNKKRNQVMHDLEQRGISTRQGTHAVHTLGLYQELCGHKAFDFPNSFAADRLSLAIPLYPSMTEEEFGFVVDALIELLKP